MSYLRVRQVAIQGTCNQCGIVRSTVIALARRTVISKCCPGDRASFGTSRKVFASSIDLHAAWLPTGAVS